MDEAEFVSLPLYRSGQDGEPELIGVARAGFSVDGLHGCVAPL